MVILTTKASSVLTHGCRASELCLRIESAGREPHIVRLASHKCTVGSDRGCTLRLRGGGVRPIECLILRTAQTAAVRAWAPGVRLNGNEIGDAPLCAGDRLSVGPVEIEILAIGAEAMPSRSSVQASAPQTKSSNGLK